MIYFYYIFLILLLFLFILKNIKVILYYFGGKYKSLGINSNCYTGILPNRDAPFWAILKKQFGDKEEISQYFVLKLKLYIFSPFSNCIAQNFAQKGASLLGESCSFGRKIYFITFSAYVLFTILLYGAFCVSSPASVIINCSLSKLSSFNTGVSFQASMSL